MNESERWIPNRASREQRVRMSLFGHPITLLGTLINFALDGAAFTVWFDGPFEPMNFSYQDGRIVDASGQEWETEGL